MNAKKTLDDIAQNLIADAFAEPGPPPDPGRTRGILPGTPAEAGGSADDLLRPFEPQPEKYIDKSTAEIPHDQLYFVVKALIEKLDENDASEANKAVEDFGIESGHDYIIRYLLPKYVDSEKLDPVDAFLKEKSTPQQEKLEVTRKKVNSEKRLTSFEQLELYKMKSIIPNIAAKTGLFAPVQPGIVAYYDEYQDVYVWGHNDLQVQFKGKQLNQYDLSVWLMIISFCHRAGGNATFSKYEALIFLQKSAKGKSNYDRIEKSIDKLLNTEIKLIFKPGTHTKELKLRSHLIQDVGELVDNSDHGNTKYFIKVSKMLKMFFYFDHFSFIEIDERLKLGRLDKALSFHALIKSNKSPLFIKWHDLQKLLHDTQELKIFKRDFKKRTILAIEQRLNIKFTVKDEGGSVKFYY